MYLSSIYIKELFNGEIMIVVKKDVSLHQPLFYCLMLAGIKIF